MSEEHQVNLFARYEQRLLSGDNAKAQVIPAVVITGFLGSGKTTLVHHILRNRGALRIAVLVNEVGQLDVDSQLVNAKQGNAALGLPAVDLSGGCVCCSKSEDLAAALRQLRAQPAASSASSASASPSSSAPCDYLLVETSGAADAGPLAEALVGGGFRLDAVVTVVDAEAGAEALRHPVARAQVCCADVVVVNKCDLMAPGAGGVGAGGGGLGALADLEDLIEEMAPGVRLVRARYGEVPLTAVLDVEPVAASDAAGGGGGGSGGAGSGGGGGGGFMSHESMPSAIRASAGGYRMASGPLTADGLAVGSTRHTQRRTQQAATTTATAALSPGNHLHPPDNHHHRHHHHHHGSPGQQPQQPPDSAAQEVGGVGSSGHSVLHSGFHTESVTVAEGPCSLGAFARFVVRRLVREPALLRSKGVLWFGERRRQRFTFHLSGRRRVELCEEGPWEAPPSSQLVLIGTNAAAMQRLAAAFRAEVATPVAEVRSSGGDGSGEAVQGVKGADERGAGAATAAAAVGVLAGQERLEVLGCESWGVGGPAPAAAEAAAAEAAEEEVGGQVLVSFTTRGSVLHGINGEEINSELMRRANASGRLLLAAVTAPGKISSVTNVQSRDRVLSLLLPCTSSEAHVHVEALLEIAEPLLRKAYAHAHNCKCDVASAMQASTR
ncbi:hypothetical protein PLESTB_000479000 [Pleodorina starrii]|uniref:CobW C-terminal domain-containing protein n=1 Tax=Pleodorina starrii TaxID=330485 RepID=A0A9W6BFD3_9CHLO|nr:hypothetical protein PLESTM_001587600 [Pleodorina starrii]GLC51221.1 hypothetical protein PLESTB_000479000 [Pleodorina starrii]GLC63579.1 hypothetical protein PLESTF_000051500 [Pleodorina starrii]